MPISRGLLQCFRQHRSTVGFQQGVSLAAEPTPKNALTFSVLWRSLLRLLQPAPAVARTSKGIDARIYAPAPVCPRIATVNTNGPNPKTPAAPRRRRAENFEEFPSTQFNDHDAIAPDLDVTASGFGGHTLPPDGFADLWRETSSAKRWRQTLWLAIGFGVVVGSVFTAACFVLLPGALRALAR